MASSSLCSFSVFLLSCCSLALLASSARFLHARPTNRDIVSSTCNRTLYSELCVSSLRSDPRSATSDLRGLAEIALNLSRTHGVETLSYIEGLKTEAANSSDKYVSGCLSDCSEEYSDAVERLQNSAGALRSKDYGAVNAWVAAAMTDSETCEEGYMENPDNVVGDGYWSPLTQRNQNFSMICSNFLAITNLLE